MAAFSGNPETEWQEDHRNMVLLKPFSYTDSDGKTWQVPAGGIANGATIPRALWSQVGAPFVGKYRRASIVHDYFVGEGQNPDVTLEERKKADKMFYDACLTDKCSKTFARMLYLGVRIGTWASKVDGWNKKSFAVDYRDFPVDTMVQSKFHEVKDTIGDDFDTIDFEEFEKRVDQQLGPRQ
jgi:hypothetical protein